MFIDDDVSAYEEIEAENLDMENICFDLSIVHENGCETDSLYGESECQKDSSDG